MMRTYTSSPASRAARALQQTHGAGSAAEASERAEVCVANVDFGGFAHWKVVERLIRSADTF